MAAYAPAPLPSLSLVFFAPDNTAGNPAPLPHLGLLLGSSTSHILAAGAGSFALTGIASLTRRSFVVAAGAYTLTGVAATLTKSTTGIGSGAPAPLPHIGILLERPATDPLMAGAAGNFSLTGIAANLQRGHGISAGAATFLLNGAPALRDMQITADVGSYTLTRNPATLSRASNGITAAKGTFVLTGNPAGFAYQTATAKVLPAQFGSFVLTGYDATLPATLQRKLSCDTGDFVVTRNSATLTAVRWGDISHTSSIWSDITPNSTTWTS